MKTPATLAWPAGASSPPVGGETAPALRTERRGPRELTRDGMSGTGGWGSACPVAHVRVLLAIGNALVIYLDPGLPIGHGWRALATTYGIVLAILAYSMWAWRQESAREPNPALPRVTAWLDVLCSAGLIAVTGAHKSPFFMWNVFTLVGSALQNGWRTAVRVCVAQTLLYMLICLPHLHGRDFRLAAFLVRTSYLFVIALVLAHMGQRLLEQNRRLAGLHRAAASMSAGRSIPEILDRVADSLTDMLEVDQVAVAWREAGGEARPALVNLDREQGERLLALVRDCLAAAPDARGPLTLCSNAADRDARFEPARDALEGARRVLITGLPDSRGGPGVLLACSRLSSRSFVRSDRELAELIAAHAGPLLETAQLQEQRRYHAGVDERRRIAVELHDRLIQTLASIDLRALSCAGFCHQRAWEPLAGELRVLKGLAEEALEEARGVVSELAPVHLREAGLAVYLEEFVRQFHERSGTPVEVRIVLNDRDMPEPTALLLIGLLREGLNNVRKHARACHVTLEIEQGDAEIAFRLADDGAGFCPDQSPLRQTPTRQYGLAYLRERVSGIGGALSVTSRPGEGTVLAARVPLLTEELLLSRFSRG
jgi:signal transduction histidine kinase